MLTEPCEELDEVELEYNLLYSDIYVIIARA